MHISFLTIIIIQNLNLEKIKIKAADNLAAFAFYYLYYNLIFHFKDRYLLSLMEKQSKYHFQNVNKKIFLTI